MAAPSPPGPAPITSTSNLLSLIMATNVPYRPKGGKPPDRKPARPLPVEDALDYRIAIFRRAGEDYEVFQWPALTSAVRVTAEDCHSPIGAVPHRCQQNVSHGGAGEEWHPVIAR